MTLVVRFLLKAAWHVSRRVLQVQLKQLRTKLLVTGHYYQFCEGQHLQICVRKELSNKFCQKERNARFHCRPVTLIPNQSLLLKDVQSFQVSFLEFQLENCFVIAVEKSCHLSEVLSRTMLHH